MALKELSSTIGLSIGLFSTWWWKLYPNWEIYIKAYKKSPLAFKDFFQGLGAGLIITELFQDHPFGIGKTKWETQGNIGMTSILGGLLTLSRL